MKNKIFIPISIILSFFITGCVIPNPGGGGETPPVTDKGYLKIERQRSSDYFTYDYIFVSDHGYLFKAVGKNAEGKDAYFSTATWSGMYTTRRSGTYVEGGRRGDGYTRFTIADLDVSSANGLVYHLFNADWVLKHGGNALTADNNLTSFPAAERRGMEIVQGGKSSFSFTSMTFYYDCTDVTPEVEITNTEVQVGVGETANLTTTKSDVYAGDTVSYAWESGDTDTLTVVGDGANATVTGVAAGTATVTVTMTVNGKDYTDSIEVTVTAAAATVVPLLLGNNCRVEGAGIFVWIDTTGTGKNANEITALSLESTIDCDFDNGINNVVLQDKNGNIFCAYTVMRSAVGLNSAFTLTYDFKDNANNTIYRAVAHWNNGALDTEIHLAASAFSVEVGADLEVTATKASWLEGNAIPDANGVTCTGSITFVDGEATAYNA